MPTRTVVRQAVSRRTGVFFTGTSDGAGGAAGTFIDTTSTMFGNSSYAARFWVGGWIYINATTERMIASQASLGNYTVSPSWSGAQNAVAYEYHSILQPSQINTAIGDALRRLRYLGYVYPTLVIDGDMEASGTSDYTSSNATLSKVATATRIFYAKQSLKVLATAAAGYAQSAQIRVSPGEVYEIDAYVNADVGTGTLRAYDNTGAATIASVTTSGEAWQRLHITATMPTGIRDLRIRLISDANSDDVYWNLVLVRRQGARRIALPTWVQTTAPLPNETDIHAIEQIVPRGASIATDVYEADAEQTTMYGRYKLDMAQDSLQYYLTLPYSPANPIRVLMWRAHPALSADADIIYVRPELIEAEAILEVYKLKEQQAPAADVSYWQQRRAEWEKGAELTRERLIYNSDGALYAWGRKR